MAPIVPKVAKPLKSMIAQFEPLGCLEGLKRTREWLINDVNGGLTHVQC